ncbi:uncharacterized protein LOC133193283 [Saccostrea echinata]|uniref:uncharacterized protein LOC133193283 n=1 Tax=Saccostrea echinata TaxID=191078 RepID=UPI002A82BC1D|nr:uncharacterized protein LOC133193283 [Saccostrea echinata]
MSWYLSGMTVDLPRQQPLLICLKQSSLEEDIFRFLTTLRPDNNNKAFFVLEEDTPKEVRKRVDQDKGKVNIIHRAKGANHGFYNLCYSILLEQVSEYTAVLSKKPNTRRNSHCLKLLKNYRGYIKDRTTAKTSQLRDEVVEKIDKAVKEATPDYNIIGYALYDKLLKIFAGSDIESKVSELVMKVRSLINKTFKGRVIAQLLKKPYIVPFTALQGGCKMRAVQVRRTGTLGMFAKCLIADQRQSVGISSGHVALKGNDIQLEISKENVLVGKCIWPETSARDANFKDISVILLNTDIADTIQYRMPQFDVKLRTDDLIVLHLRKVFKFGAKTNRTLGYLKSKNLLRLRETEAMCIKPEEGERQFSEEGDSGSVVFTQKGRDLIAIGIVFGGNLKLIQTQDTEEENSSDFKEGDCIAIDLKDAIRYFESSGEGTIFLEKF